MKKYIFLAMIAFVLTFSGMSVANDVIESYIFSPNSDASITDDVVALVNLDQESPCTTAGYNADSSTLNWQQEVKTGVSGLLSGIEVSVSTIGSTDIYINVGPAWQADANDFYTTVTASATGWFYIDTSAANINLNADDMFVIGIQGTDGGLWLCGNASPAVYTDGDLWLNGALYAIPDEWDIGFRTYMTTNSLTISPASGAYVTTQSFDLTLIIEAPGLSVVVSSATLDGSDVTAGLASCVIPGTLVSGGTTLRCPGITGSFLGTGAHTLDVTLDLSDGTSVSDTVTWDVIENTEL